jgi:anti-sigma B factor antagonist
MNLTVSSRIEGDVTVLAPAGEIDIETAPVFRGELVESINGGARQIVIDMAGVEFCDSTALSVLIACHQRLKPVGGTITLANVRPMVRKIFDVTKLADLFGLSSTDDALSA